MTALIDARNIEKHFSLRGSFGQRAGIVRAVDGVSLTINSGETLALVGESGSGKTTLGRCLLNITQPTRGTVLYNGQDGAQLSPRQQRQLRQTMQVVFQDPYSSLNPRRTALQQVIEPIALLTQHSDPSSAAREILARVGITGYDVDKYPRAFSGGQRQRIGIARALSVDPQFVMCDEPVSALDLSIQAQILQLLDELQHERGLTYLFISHDLSVVRKIATRVAVMHRGKLVEVAPCETLFHDARHPYTRQLLQAAPVADPKQARQQAAQRRTHQDIALSSASEGTLEEVAPGHLVLGG